MNSDEEVVLRLGKIPFLMFVGWVQAHRPSGDWEPGFLTAVLQEFDRAVKGEP